MQDILRNVNWEKDTCGTIKIYFYYKGQDCIYQKKGGMGQDRISKTYLLVRAVKVMVNQHDTGSLLLQPMAYLSSASFFFFFFVYALLNNYFFCKKNRRYITINILRFS